MRQTLEHNITWVLRKYRIELEKYPTKESGDIHIKTYAEPCRNLFSLRSFKLWDSRGEFLGSAYTWWVLLDFVKQRPMRLDKCELMTAFKERVSEVLPPDVKIPAVTSTSAGRSTPCPTKYPSSWSRRSPRENSSTRSRARASAASRRK